MGRGEGAFELRLLAGFELRTPGRRLSVPFAVQRLLAFLALADHPLHRRYVAGSLWLDTTEQRAAANLRATLWRLPQPQAALVTATPSQLVLAPSVDVDHRAATARAWRVISAGGAGLDDVDDERLLTADLLPGWTEDWVAVERERMHQLRLHALEALCVRLAERGSARRALDVGFLAVAADPLRESARRALITAQLVAGDVTAARREYQSYCALLADTGITPSSRMRHLVAGVVPSPH